MAGIYYKKKQPTHAVRYPRRLSPKTMKYAHLGSNDVPRMHSYREKIKRMKTSDISLLERFPEQIAISSKIFKLYCIIHTR